MCACVWKREGEKEERERLNNKINCNRQIKKRESSNFCTTVIPIPSSNFICILPLLPCPVLAAFQAMDTMHEIDLGTMEPMCLERMHAEYLTPLQPEEKQPISRGKPLTRFMRTALETVASKIGRGRDVRKADLEIFHVKLSTIENMIEAAEDLGLCAHKLLNDLGNSAQAQMEFSDRLHRLCQAVPSLIQPITKQICVTKSTMAYAADLVCALDTFCANIDAISSTSRAGLVALKGIYRDYTIFRKEFDTSCNSLSKQEKRIEAAASYNRLQKMHENFQTNLDMLMHEKVKMPS